MLVGDIYGGRDYTGIGLSGAPPCPSPRIQPFCPLFRHTPADCCICARPSQQSHPPTFAANTIASSFGKVVNQEKASALSTCSVVGGLPQRHTTACAACAKQLPVCRQDLLTN
jgi:hypothetical protein